MEDTGAEAVWDRRSWRGGGGHRMAWGPRPVVGLIWATCASSHVFSPLHGCRWNIGFPCCPVPSVLAQVGVHCPVLLSFLMMFNFFSRLLTSEVAILKVLCMFSLHIYSSLPSLPALVQYDGKLKGGEKWRTSASCFGTLINNKIMTEYLTKTKTEDSHHLQKYLTIFSCLTLWKYGTFSEDCCCCCNIRHEIFLGF